VSELQPAENSSDIDQQIQREGYCLLRGALDADGVRQLRERCTEFLGSMESGDHARSSRGHVYAARNLLEAVPEVQAVWQSGVMLETLRAVLGDGLGLVRVLYFDKPPGRTWGLPWHKDMSIAVAEHGAESPHFSRPTRKAGVPHVIADEAILKRMLTLRIHLDDVTDENGPLRLIPRSHHSTSMAAELGAWDVVTILARAGDVLAMRPLLDHASGPSLPGTDRHRRILHLEFAADATLPDGYRWFHFVPR
jgi:ectoine hydroxylase-related dioxygenase (phytanoyl-CoA dioxygenase family)